MKRGIAPIVSVVLLLMIVMAGAVSILFWITGTTSPQPVPQRAIPILATPVSNDYVTMTVLIANLGNRPIPAGTILYTLENEVSTVLPETIDAGCQALVTFEGYDENGVDHYFPTGTYTIYGKQEGMTGASTVSAYIDTSSHEPDTTNKTEPRINQTVVMINESVDYDVTIASCSNALFIVWGEQALPTGKTNHIYYSHSLDGGATWSEPVKISDSQTNVNPSVIANCTDAGCVNIIVAWEFDNPSNLHIFAKNASDGTTWSDKYQLENMADQNRQPSIALDNAGRALLAWASGPENAWDITVKRADSFQQLNPAPAITVDANAAPDSFPNIMQGSNNVYWVLFESNRSGQAAIWASSSTDFTTWNAPVQLVADGREPSFMQDHDGEYWIAYYTTGAEPYVWVRHSTDMNAWSQAIRVSNLGDEDRSPSLSQDLNGVYWIAYESRLNGNYTVYVKSTTNARYWQN